MVHSASVPRSGESSRGSAWWGEQSTDRTNRCIKDCES